MISAILAVIIASCQLTAVEPTLWRQHPPNRKPGKKNTAQTPLGALKSPYCPRLMCSWPLSEACTWLPRPSFLPTPYPLPCLHSLPSRPSAFPCFPWSHRTGSCLKNPSPSHSLPSLECLPQPHSNVLLGSHSLGSLLLIKAVYKS